MAPFVLAVSPNQIAGAVSSSWRSLVNILVGDLFFAVIGHQLVSGMVAAFQHSPPTVNLVFEESALLHSTSYRFHSRQYLRCNTSDLKPYQTLASASSLRGLIQRVAAVPEVDDFFWEKDPTPILDKIDAPIHLKNLSRAKAAS